MAQQGSDPLHRIGRSRDERELRQRDDEERSRQHQHGSAYGGEDQQTAFNPGGRQMGESVTDADRPDGFSAGSFSSQDRYASTARWGGATERHLDLDDDAEWRHDRYKKFSDEFDTLRHDRAARSDVTDGSTDRSAAGSGGPTGSASSASSATDAAGPDRSSGGVDHAAGADPASGRGDRR